MDSQQRPIGYWLVQLDDLINQHLGHTLAEHDLTRRQWQVLNLVVHGPCDLATIDQSVAPFLTAAEPTVAADGQQPWLAGTSMTQARPIVPTNPDPNSIAIIERSMLAIRRRQTRRALSQDLPQNDVWVGQVVDALEAAGTALSVGQIASLLGVDQSQASRRVTRAIDHRVAERIAAQDDGRKSLVRLTRRGRDLAAQMHANRQRAIAAAVLEWSATDQKRLAHLLERFVLDFEAAQT